MADLRRGVIKALDIIPKEQRADALTAWLIERISGCTGSNGNSSTRRQNNAGRCGSSLGPTL